MPLLPRPRALAGALGAATVLGLGLATVVGPEGPRTARAQGTPGLMEFRWENNKDYRKLYFYMTDTVRMRRSDYFLILRPKDRKTAMLKLTVSIPDHFDAKIDPKRIRFCKMSEGGMLKRTRCEKVIPATIEVAANSSAIEVFPETPVSDKDTVGLEMTLINPFNAGMYQFNALAQPPGDPPISTYLGSWLIQIDPN